MTDLTDELSALDGLLLPPGAFMPPAYAGQTELTADHFWRGDIPPDPLEVPVAWTRDRAPNGLHKGQYQGGQQDAETGEVTGGTWGDAAPLSPEELAAAALKALTSVFVGAVSNHMDQAAQQRRYDGILSLCTYATSTDATFAAEGQAGLDFRDACWRYCYDTLADVEAGKRQKPEIEAFLGELPKLAWPYPAK